MRLLRHALLLGTLAFVALGSAAMTSVVGEPDPNTANNKNTLRFEVTQPSTGAGVAAAVSTSVVKLSTAKPKAGSTLVASVRVTRGGSPLKPNGIACAASTGGAKVKGGAKSSLGQPSASSTADSVSPAPPSILSSA